MHKPVKLPDLPQSGKLALLTIGVMTAAGGCVRYPRESIIIGTTWVTSRGAKGRTSTRRRQQSTRR
jgi:hypothetical protein